MTAPSNFAERTAAAIPWSLDGPYGSTKRALTNIRDASGVLVAACVPVDKAEMIINAVGAHADLCATLREVLDFLPHGATPTTRSLFSRWRDVLARAEGRQS